MPTNAKFLDATWQRVESFDEAGPSCCSDADGNDISMRDVDDDCDEGDSVWTYEEEEELVTLDLGPDSKRLVQMSQEYSISGLETAHPFLQLGNIVFKGVWDQLIGTEIILHDRRDTNRPSSHTHDLWPLPATPSDRRHNRAPSSTRRRIVLRQATNMAAKEAALAPIDDSTAPPALHIHAPVLREERTGLVTYKGWVWVRGRGWMRKEKAAMLERAGGSGAATADSATEQEQANAAIAADEAELAREDADADAAANDNAEEAATDDNLQEVGSGRAAADAPDDDRKPAGNRGGRKKLSDGERIRYQVFRAMRKIELSRSGQVESDEEGDG